MARLAPGFRFHPTDVELIMYYLKRKIMGKKLLFEGITELNIYRVSPWDLPGKCCYKSKDLEWYFFCPRERKYASGARMNRATETGYWKTTGKDRLVTYDEKIVGSVKTLVFHLGHPPRGQRTDWVIHEFKFEDKESIDAGFSQDSYVLCKVFQKSGPGPKNGAQYGAPFIEEDWDDDKIPAEPCPLDVFPAPPGRPDSRSKSVVTGVVDPGSTSDWPSSELSLSPIRSSIQRSPLDEPDDEELPGEPKPANVSPISRMPSDQLDDEGVHGQSNLSNIFSPLPILPEGHCMVKPGPGPSNDQMCTNEMPLDEQDDEIFSLLAPFTEDTSLLSAGDETKQNLENFNQDVNAPPATLTDGNDIFAGLGGIEYWAGGGQPGSDLFASDGADYSFNPMILTQDSAYMELNDLDIPLDHSADTIGTGQLVASNFCAPYNSNIGLQQPCFGSNSMGIVQDFGEHNLPMLPESYTHSQQVNHSDMVYNFQNDACQGYNAATNFSVSSYTQPEASRLDAQNLERGVQQRKFYLSVFALCDGSFILVKAEVTLGVDGCTDDALSVILGNPSRTFTCGSTVDKAGFLKKHDEAFYFGFSLDSIYFSHLEVSWELYQYIFLKIVLNQLQFNSSGKSFHLRLRLIYNLTMLCFEF
ncbi:NAC domain-containing protein 82 [Capsicum annuum]|uniref:NAC domain-containing protein 82 n=1 Tax=Capsicum annuum TaxID=4072 RepID=UPI001FB1989D|nr:NAC domain-containing protein 82 [Capsicum annuum]